MTSSITFQALKNPSSKARLECINSHSRILKLSNSSSALTQELIHDVVIKNHQANPQWDKNEKSLNSLGRIDDYTFLPPDHNKCRGRDLELEHNHN